MPPASVLFVAELVGGDDIEELFRVHVASPGSEGSAWQPAINR